MTIKHRRLSLTNLETVCLISRLGTFHAAAEHLNTTQSAVSGRVRELENSTGMCLFQRRGRRMELTVPGRELVRRMEPVLRHIEDLVVSLDNPLAATGTIRIGVGEVAGLSWLGAMLMKTQHLMPNVGYALEVNLNMVVRQKLENGKLDLAFSSGPFDETRISSISIGRTRFIWVISPLLTAELAPGALGKECFEKFPVWSLPHPAAMFPATQDALRRAGSRGIEINTCDYLSVLSQVIIAGGGLALLPENLVMREIANRKLIRLGPDLAPEDIEFFVAWHTDQETAMLRHVIDAVVQSSTFLRVPNVKQ